MNLDHHVYGALASALIQLVEAAGHGRIAFVLEGGYDLYALSDSVRAVGSALLGTSIELPQGKLHERERAAIDETCRRLAPHWKFLQRTLRRP
jgi:acetoin utilization deacetylase AcuC-like enzyme